MTLDKTAETITLKNTPPQAHIPFVNTANYVLNESDIISEVPDYSSATNQKSIGCNFRARPAAMERYEASSLQTSLGAKGRASHHIYIYIQHLWDEYCTSLYFGSFEPT